MSRAWRQSSRRLRSLERPVRRVVKGRGTSMRRRPALRKRTAISAEASKPSL
ncbi:MAG: hypothetical protein HY922_16525 [Elusimicrobia bacterium]|nr:hypothetical protein [Elusimicrobiota bacterium]